MPETECASESVDRGSAVGGLCVPMRREGGLGVIFSKVAYHTGKRLTLPHQASSSTGACPFRLGRLGM